MLTATNTTKNTACFPLLLLLHVIPIHAAKQTAKQQALEITNIITLRQTVQIFLYGSISGIISCRIPKLDDQWD